MLTIIIHNLQRATAGVAALALLGGCIANPLPGGTSAELYSWNNTGEPIASTEAIASADFGGFWDGDLDFSDILLKLPGLDTSPDTPYLLRACDLQLCYQAVLFPGDFTLDDNGLVRGAVSLSALSTALANEVRSLPAAQVRAALDALAAPLMTDRGTDYASFLALDYRRLSQHRDQLAQTELDAIGLRLLNNGAQPTLTEIIEIASQTTADLEVPDGFIFSSAWDMTLDVDVAQRIGDQGYFLLCGDFEVTEEGGYRVDYGNCQLRAPLHDGKYQGSLRMTASATNLLAIVMRFDMPENAQYTLWDRRIDGDHLVIR
jgi:hypothetical protein